MRKDFCYIGVVLDRSGSMGSIHDATVEAMDSFIADQKKEAGHAHLYMLQFDDQFDVLYDGAIQYATSIKDTYHPRGSTALYDATAKTITEIGNRLKTMHENDRPDKVVIVIMTDGYENASKKTTSDKLQEMIAHQRDVYKWQFVFLGANQDAIVSAAKIGISAATSATFAANMQGVTASIGAFTSNLRSYRKSGVTQDLNYTTDQRTAMIDDQNPSTSTTTTTTQTITTSK